MFLKQLHYLREIERYRSFSKAAKACNVSQPALSRAVRQLEEELGVTIIDRKKKVFGITGDGARVLKWAHDILRGVTELRNEVSVAKKESAGIIKIGVIPTAVHIVPAVIEAVEKRCGDCGSEVFVLPNLSIIEKLISRELDIGVMYYDQCPQAKAFEVRTLYAEQQVVAASTTFPLPDGDSISWESAARLPLALLSKDMRCRQLVDIGFQAIGIEPRVRLETSSLELIHAEVMSGRVATILPTSSFPLRVPPQSRIKIRRLDGPYHRSGSHLSGWHLHALPPKTVAVAQHCHPDFALPDVVDSSTYDPRVALPPPSLDPLTIRETESDPHPQARSGVFPVWRSQ